MKLLIKQLNAVASHLGYGKVYSYDKLYKTAINTFAGKGSSVWFFTISLNDKNECIGIEVNSTYFEQTEQVKAINSACSFDNPSTLTQILSLIYAMGLSKKGTKLI